jgi:mannose-6-phosphate isomerase-like protein (cupin superfamily)
MELTDINNNKTLKGLKLKKNVHIITDQLMATSLLIDSNTTLPAHVHDSNDEIIYIVEGKGEITIDNESSSVHEGMLIFVPKTKSHFITTSDVPIYVLTFSKLN